MSDIIEAVLLGIVQGLTEFLPVSSSGHLEIFKYFFDYDEGAQQSLLMTVTLHGATASSTLVVFWKDIISICKDLFRFQWNEGTRLVLFIIVSMVPAVAIGLLFEDNIEAFFEGNIPLVCTMLVVTGVLLLIADRIENGLVSVGFKNSIVVGLAQAFAILPGVSRSGATISTSLLIGIDRGKAARFSFLMVLPLIFGKMILDLMDGDYGSENTKLDVLLAGSIAAFVVGILACKWMIKIVRRSQLKYFAYYCWATAILVMSYYYIWN
jgi:undecaprenyl-diphosphatase